MKEFALIAVPTCALTGSAMADGWHDSPWGPDDEIGAANHIIPESVLDGQNSSRPEILTIWASLSIHRRLPLRLAP